MEVLPIETPAPRRRGGRAMSESHSTKTCTKCRLAKTLDLFSRNASRPSGLQDWCKKCTAAYKKIMRKEYATRYARRPYAIRYAKLKAFRRRKHCPEKLSARERISCLIRRGKIPMASSLTCGCGFPASQYQHHKGYSRENREDVIPMCLKCHLEADSPK